MTIGRPLLLSVLLLATGACTVVDKRTTPAQVSDAGEPPTSTPELLQAAGALADAGRWAEAVDMLEFAQRNRPQDARLAGAIETTREDWRRAERAIEDRIMVGDAENQQSRIALLAQLSLADPNDLIVTSRRIYWRELLADKIEPLTACGEFHAATRPQLARRCFDIATTLPATDQTEQRLARVSEQLRASENLAAAQRHAKREKIRHRQAKALLGEARAAIDAGEYRKALDTLQRVAELQPNNREAAGLRQEAMRRLSPQVEALIKLGDHLYLDEQLKAAVATWQAALTLKPDDEDILARIERAQTVLQRLEELRQQQSGTQAGVREQ